MQSRCKHTLGGDDVERLQRRDSRQQIEVGGKEPIRIGDPVGDGNDDVAERIGRHL